MTNVIPRIARDTQAKSGELSLACPVPLPSCYSELGSYDLNAKITETVLDPSQKCREEVEICIASINSHRTGQKLCPLCLLLDLWGA